jgi:hypothetical protein
MIKNIKKLIKLANDLDELGLHKESDEVEELAGDVIAFEPELEEETINKSVEEGDWIVKAMTKAGEEYSVRKDKFPKLYEEEPVGQGPDGFMVYNVRPDDRTGILISPSLAEELKNNYPDGTVVPQSEFHSWLQVAAPTVTVRKQSQVFAKQARGGEEIVTRVEKGGEEIISFEAPWGGSMPIKLNDVLIINEDEVYRIARSEFDQTYEGISDE